MSFIRLSDGSKFDPFSHDLAMKAPPKRAVFIHALANISRYTGHTKRPLSVLEHSYRLARNKQVRLRGLSRAALLHDFNEAVTNDLPRPFKAALPEFCIMEESIQRLIFAHWNEPWENMALLEEFDHQICIDEMTQLYPCKIEPWDEPLGVHFPPKVDMNALKLKFRVLCDKNGIR